MTIDELKARKKELGYSNRELAELSGVPLGTLQKIFSGATGAPRRAAIEALTRVLQPGNTPRESSAAYTVSKSDDEIPSGPQGKYTLKDYYALPDERRAELIDGVIYDLAAPGNLHQAISQQIALQLGQYVSDNQGSCMIYTAPFDVQLDEDDRTMVQPDVVIVCRRDRLRRFGCFGAPDLVMEIISPSTARRDMLLKLQKYIHANVREYWIIHPDIRQVTVYRNGEQLELKSYSFEEKIPVGIWEDKFSVDFAQIYDRIAFLYDLEE
ncbi:MAG: Uma2 family endonuclease [Lachnospiraceae bacterium]|nr:Uma2 family endonuclease [Lachnospiraceae bacterium]